MVIGLKLTSTNYVTWSRQFMLALSIHNKIRFVNGTIQEPKITNKMYVLWMCSNNLIVAWLIESISPMITSTIFYMKSAHRVWETLNKRFSQPYDVCICHLQVIFTNANQGTRTIDAYVTELNAILEELKGFRLMPVCDCDTCNERCFQ
ncbi:hypothetical protein QUC31_007204 [Theobroma cacao]